MLPNIDISLKVNFKLKSVEMKCRGVNKILYVCYMKFGNPLSQDCILDNLQKIQLFFDNSYHNWCLDIFIEEKLTTN